MELRGWDYPHDPREGTTRHSDFIQGVVSWENYHELWRLYQSAQFVHIFAMREDWWEENSFSQAHPPVGTALSYASTLFTLTEIFTYAARLAEATSILSDVSCSYRLYGLGGRRLMTFDPNRSQFDGSRKASADLSDFGNVISVPPAVLIGQANPIAIEQAMMVFERLNWNAPKQMLVDDQRKFLERRI